MGEPSAYHDPAFPTEADVDAALEEFGDDHRAAIRALLSDIAVLARDFEGAVSYGFMRGELPRLVLKGRT